MKSDTRLRIASLQYALRPIRDFSEFAAQCEAWVRNAADYKARLVLFPEYFSLQLLSLGDTSRPLPEQLRAVAALLPRFREAFAAMARRHGIIVAAGSFPSLQDEARALWNECHLFTPEGGHGVQPKLRMTRFEREDFHVSAPTSPRMRVFDTSIGRLAVAICYDVEFPELVRAAALEGARLLLVPSSTDDRQGYWRVRHCAQARAVENQLYVVQSSTVGSLPEIPAACLHYGQSALITPSDYGFARDGVLAEGIANAETMVVGDFDLKLLEHSRTEGSVLTLKDGRELHELTPERKVDLVRL